MSIILWYNSLFVVPFDEWQENADEKPMYWKDLGTIARVTSFGTSTLLYSRTFEILHDAFTPGAQLLKYQCNTLFHFTYLMRLFFVDQHVKSTDILLVSSKNVDRQIAA